MINWDTIKTGYGNASHIPEAIDNLFSLDEKVRHDAYWKLDNFVVVQSDLYEAAFYIIEPIVQLLEKPYKSDRVLALRILIEVAIGGNGDDTFSFNDNGKIQILSLDEACKTKFKNLKKRIERIEVRTKDETEELSFLLESIE